MAEDATLARLDDQINWYDQKSRYNQIAFKILKLITVVVAASISVVSLFLIKEIATRTAAILGARW